MKIYSFKFLYIFFLLLISNNIFAQQENLYAGFRASRINTSYPDSLFPGEDYWVYAGNKIADKFDTASPSAIWLVSFYQDDGKTILGFPFDGNNINNVVFSDVDLNEEYLSRFDKEGFKVYLQIEPGDANIDTLIVEILSRYGHHPCVVGFGIDVEWLNPTSFEDGRKVTDDEAMRWEANVKSFNQDYILFLKHYFYDWMPPKYRGDILFVDDGQQFPSLSLMLDDFKEWAANLKGSTIAYQFGYPSDESWWKSYPDPAKEIGQTLLDSIPGIAGLYWVDFSINTIIPVIPSAIKDESIAGDFELFQNYPNPFNPSTNLRFRISNFGFVKLKIYDILGNEVATLINEEKPEGSYEVKFNGSELTSGIYFYRLTSGSFSETKRMLLIK